MSSAAIVTGGAGFIGSHLVDALLGDGVRVVVIDDLTSGDERRVAPEADLRPFSIVDQKRLDETIDEVAPDAVFHLGAQSSVTVSVSDPVRDNAVNVRGTLNLLEALRRRSTPLVFTSTGGALYGNEAAIPTSEDSLPAPVSPYGASKWGGEAYINTWAAAYDTPHAICRLGNVYGPRQSPHGEAGVVSIFTHHIYEGRPPKMFGEGTPTRDYIHVTDVVAALRAALGHRGTFNVATGIERDVRSLWDVLASESETDIEPEPAPLRQGELRRSCMDPSRARRKLGFEARVPFDEGLRSTYRALVEQFKSGSAR